MKNPQQKEGIHGQSGWKSCLIGPLISDKGKFDPQVQVTTHNADNNEVKGSNNKKMLVFDQKILEAIRPNFNSRDLSWVIFLSFYPEELWKDDSSSSEDAEDESEDIDDDLTPPLLD